MKEKLMSRKFWIAVFSNIISIISIFTDIGGKSGTILGIIGTILSSVIYILMEGMVDSERIKADYNQIKSLIDSLKKGGE